MKLRKMRYVVLALAVCMAITTAALLVTNGRAAESIMFQEVLKITQSSDTTPDLGIQLVGNAVSFQVQPELSGVTYEQQIGMVEFTNVGTESLTVSFSAKRVGPGTLEFQASDYYPRALENEDRYNYLLGKEWISSKYGSWENYKNEAVKTITTEAYLDFKFELDAGKCFKMFIQTPDNASDTTPTQALIEKLSVNKESEITVDLNGPESGYYTVQPENGEQPTTVFANSNDTISFNGIENLSLHYYPAEDQTKVFDCWRVTDKKGNVTAEFYEDSVSYAGFKDGDTISVVLKEAGHSRPFLVGDRQFFDWDSAMGWAVDNGGGTVILRADYKLPDVSSASAGRYVTIENGKATYIVPQGVNLVIPKSNEDRGTFNTNIAQNENAATLDSTKPTLFRKLEIPETADVLVQGKLNVNATITGRDGFYQAIVSGNYGCITLAKNAQLTLAENSELYCYGYINGEGMVVAESGATSYEPLQITDWGGGSAALAFVNAGDSANKDAAFYFSQYYVQNIEATYRVKYGANAMAVGVFRAKLGATEGFLSTPADYITSKGLFRLAAGSHLDRSYNKMTDRSTYAIYGDLETGSISVSLAGTELNSQNWSLGLNGNLDMNIMSGTTTLKADYMILPGVKINVAADAKLKAAKGVLITLWNQKDWYMGESSDTDVKTFLSTKDISSVAFTHNGTLAPVYYTTADTNTGSETQKTAAGTYRTAQRSKSESAQITVNGTLEYYSNIYETNVLADYYIQSGQIDTALKMADSCISGSGTIINHANTSRYGCAYDAAGDLKRSSDEEGLLKAEEGSVSYFAPIVYINGQYDTNFASTLRFPTVPVYARVTTGEQLNISSYKDAIQSLIKNTLVEQGFKADSAVSQTVDIIREGQYYPHEDTGWYQHQVTWTITANGMQIPIEKYYNTADVVQQTELLGHKVKYTSVTPKTEGVTYGRGPRAALDSNTLEEGWADIKLSGVQQMAEVDFAFEPYDHSVTWERYKDNWDAPQSAETKTHFITDSSDTFEWDAANGSMNAYRVIPLGETADGKTENVPNFEDKATGITVSSGADGKSARAENISNDVTVQVLTTTGLAKVYVYYKADAENFQLLGTYDAVKSDSGFSLTDNIQITSNEKLGDGHYIINKIAADPNGTPLNSASVTVSAEKNGTELSVKNANGTVSIYLTLEKKDYKVDFAPIDGIGAIDSVYMNAGETIQINCETGVNYTATNSKYYFVSGSADKPAEVRTDDGTNLYISGVSSDTLVTPIMEAYKYKVEIRNQANLYFTEENAADGLTYTLPQGKYLAESGYSGVKGSVLSAWVTANGSWSTNGPAAVSVKPVTVNENTLETTQAEIKVSNVKGDGVLQVLTREYKYAVLLKNRVVTDHADKNGSQLFEYIAFDNGDNRPTTIYRSKFGKLVYTESNDVRQTQLVIKSDATIDVKTANNAASPTVTVKTPTESMNDLMVLSNIQSNAVLSFDSYVYTNTVKWTTNDATKSAAAQNSITDYLQISSTNGEPLLITSGAKNNTVASVYQVGKANYEKASDGTVTAAYTAPDGYIVSQVTSESDVQLEFDPGAGKTIRAKGLTTITNSLANTTITLTQKEYAHTVKIQDAQKNVLDTVYVDAQGYDVRYDNNQLATFEQAGKYIQSYTVAPDVTAVLDGKNPAGSKYGWKKLSIPAESAKSGDIVVTLTLADYTHTIQWIVNDSASSGYTEYHYVTDMATDTFTAPDSKMIRGATNASISADKKSATYTGNGTAAATVTLTDEKPMVSYIVKDGDTQQTGSAQSDNGSWTYTITQPGKVLDTVIIQGDQGVTTVNTLTKLEINNISKSITVEITLKDKPAQDIVIPPVNPLPDENGNLVAYTGYTALWGDMNFQYYKNSAHYVYDAEKSEYVWVPGNTYAWRHATGSQTYTLNLQKDGKVEATDISVPNGSILLLNCSGKTISYTVKLDKSAADANTGWAVMKWTTSGDGKVEENGDNVITITLAPGQQMLVSGTMTGTTTEKFTNASVGKITVGMVEIH